MLTSDAGGLLLREVATRNHMMERIGASFTDGRGDMENRIKEQQLDLENRPTLARACFQTSP
ncbi:MAG: hypothetical protein R3E12_01370 [Candidatus Eisenbacteria bacterium]|uniref:Uncharacterized protein n=1 Tax=Eiseniibacteriota bacterium TaxID=2212470 RepID=A0A956LZA2_UNCEI|nr:hypothetical protein [Candidatus Eisenbacteria bacterium]